MIDLINALFYPVTWGPTVWEVADDWKKDVHKKTDVAVRVVLILVVGACYALVHMVVNDLPFYWYAPRGMAMATANFIFVFNYAMAARFAPQNEWFTYLSESPLDQLEAKINPWLRFIIRLIIMSLASVWYW